jgi:hypothetical protein
MPGLQRAAGIASLLNALISIANVLVVLGILGTEMVSDPTLVAEYARNNPFPIVVLELLKIFSAVSALFVVFGIYQRLKENSSRSLQFATLAGIVSVLLLLTAGSLGLLTIALANRTEGITQSFGIPAYLKYSMIINNLGLAAVLANGIWYILVSFTGISTELLPRRLGYVGAPLGTVSLIAFVLPSIALLVLILGLIWSTWLGLFLLREPSPRKIAQTNILEVFK